MLYQKNDSNTYIQEFRKRFGNFCEKAPILLSFTTQPTLVQVINENDDMVFEIPFDFSIPVKAFIHGIKNMLVARGCYPILHKVETSPEEVSTEEQISMAVEGASLDAIPVKRYKKKVTPFLIDKCIVFRDTFIIKNLETEEMFRYHMNKSCIFFLKKYRSGKFTKEEAADYFFKNSTLLNQILLKEDKEYEAGQQRFEVEES